MNKLDRDFLPSVKLRDIAFILSVLTLRTNGCNNSQQCCVRLLGAESFTGLKLCTRTPNNTQQHATGCANDAACTIQQFWKLLANNAKIASIVKNVFMANLCICILGVNSSNGGITNPKCGMAIAFLKIRVPRSSVAQVCTEDTSPYEDLKGQTH